MLSPLSPSPDKVDQSIDARRPRSSFLTSKVTSSLILSRASPDDASSCCSCSDSSSPPAAEAATAAALSVLPLVPCAAAAAVPLRRRRPKVRLGGGILGLEPLRGEDDGGGAACSRYK